MFLWRGKAERTIISYRFVVLTFWLIYMSFILFYSFPTLQLSIPYNKRDPTLYVEGALWTIILHLLVGLFVASFIATASIDPGGVPDTDEWTKEPRVEILREREADGSLRWDPREGKFKPDRAVYCRPEERVILKMDHYCPWMLGPIGFYNYKFFLLTVFYGTAALAVFNLCIFRQLFRRQRLASLSLLSRYICTWSLVLGAPLLLVLVLLLAAHLRLLARNCTTMESARGASGVYDLGSGLENCAAALGANPHLWLLPFVGGPIGDGFHFPRQPRNQRLYFYPPGLSHLGPAVASRPVTKRVVPDAALADVFAEAEAKARRVPDSRIVDLAEISSRPAGGAEREVFEEEERQR